MKKLTKNSFGAQQIQCRGSSMMSTGQLTQKYFIELCFLLRSPVFLSPSSLPMSLCCSPDFSRPIFVAYFFFACSLPVLFPFSIRIFSPYSFSRCFFLLTFSLHLLPFFSPYVLHSLSPFIFCSPGGSGHQAISSWSWHSGNQTWRREIPHLRLFFHSISRGFSS